MQVGPARKDGGPTNSKKRNFLQLFITHVPWSCNSGLCDIIPSNYGLFGLCMPRARSIVFALISYGVLSRCILGRFLDIFSRDFLGSRDSSILYVTSWVYIYGSFKPISVYS